MEFQFTVSDGVLSAIRRTDQLPVLYQQGLHSNPNTEWLQTTAAISNGSSGGPLLTREGHLVGLNTWVASGQNLGFAISVKHLLELRRKVESAATPFPLPDAAVILNPNLADSEFPSRNLAGVGVAFYLMARIGRLLEDQGTPVEQRRITIDEVLEAIRSGAMQEAFGAGTAAIIAPVGRIAYRGEVFTIRDESAGELTRQLYDQITGIQLGEIPDRFGWNRVVPLAAADAAE